MAKLVVLFVTAFVDTVGAALVVPILPYYATRYGASASMVGVLVAVFCPRWWVQTIFWWAETPETPIPERYMQSEIRE